MGQKRIFRILDELSPSEWKLKDLPRKAGALYNLHFNEYGQLEKRKGYSKHNTTSIGITHKISGLFRFYKQDTSEKEMLCAWYEDLYKIDNDSPHGAESIQSSLTANADTYFETFRNHCYIVNGEQNLMKYNLTNVRSVGMAVPDTPTFNANSNGALTEGNYYFKVTYVDEDGFESNGSSASAVMTALADTDDGIVINIPSANIDAVTFEGAGLNDATSGGVFSGNASIDYKIRIDAGDPTDPNTFEWSDDGGSTWDVTDVAITGAAQDLNNGVTIIFGATTGHTLNEYWTFSATVDPKIDKRRIYRTVAEGGRYFYDGEVADNTTDTYDSIISDAAIYLKSELHTDHNTPPDAPDLLCKRRNRMNLGVDEDLYVSKLSDIDYYPVAQYFPTGNAQKITGLEQQLITLPAFTEDSIERLIGTDEDNFEFRNAFSIEGCVAKRSLANCKNLLAYLGFNGIFYFDGTTSGFFSYELNEYLKENMNYSFAHLSCATFFGNKYMLCYPKGVSEVPNEVVYYDFMTKTHGIYSLSFSCFCRWDKGGDGNQLYAGSNTEGRIYKGFDGLDDDGSVITAYDRVEPVDLGNPDTYKKWYSIYIKVKTKDGLITSSGLAIGTTTDRVANDAFTYAINGTVYSKTATVAGTEPGDDVIPQNKYGAVAFDIGINETIDVIEAANNAVGYTSAALAIAAIPVVAEDHVRMGTVTVIKSDGTFTFGTTALSADNVTVVYTNNLGIAMRMYYTLDGNTETYIDETLTANKTEWYRIGFGSAGLRARALAFRPYISDKYDFAIMGYALVYSVGEVTEWMK